MRHGTILILAAIVLGAAPAVFAAEQFTPSDDMYSDPNHGGLENTVTQLWCATFSGAGHYERIMIKFDQTELETLGASVSSATLNLYRFFRCPSHYYTSTDIYAASEDWDEDTWPVTSHVSHEETAVQSFVFGPDNDWYAIDVTDLVNSWLSGERANYGLVIEARTGEKFSKFYSKDHGSSSVHPYLEAEPTTDVPDAAALAVGCAPNPFNPRTEVSFTLPRPGDARVSVIDQRGRQVRLLADGAFAEGTHTVTWDGRDERARSAPAGVYMVLVEQGTERRSARVSLVK